MLEGLEGFDAVFDQCQFGCTLPDEYFINQFIKKLTRLRCTDEDMAMDLSRQCPGGYYIIFPLKGHLLELDPEQKPQLSISRRFVITSAERSKGAKSTRAIRTMSLLLTMTMMR